MPRLPATSPHAGLLRVSRVFRSLGLPKLIAANLDLRKRQRGFSEGQLIESLCLLRALGGECPEDSKLLADEFRDGHVPAKQDPLTCAQGG